MNRSCALSLFIFLLSCALCLTGCPEEAEPGPKTSIRLTLTSTVDIDRLRLRLRTADTNQTDEIIQDVSGKDLITEGYILVLRPSAIFSGEFFIYGQGYRGSETKPIVAESALLAFEENTEVSLSLVLREGFTDNDGDGFEQCTDGDLCDCDDSQDRGDKINPYLPENCEDPYDNNCDGVANEGCPCVEDAPCTDLPPNLWDFAGVGGCHFGILTCLDSEIYAIECEDAGSPITEVLYNYIDDDCDGDVDEGATCVVGTTRPCFLGFVDDPSNPTESDRLAASDRALGECIAGVQACSFGGVWESCNGENRPQRTLFEETNSDGEVVLREGIGWTEVLITGKVDQCDGLDNDCDGNYDEESHFDVDQDYYTYCGTCVSTSSPRICDEYVDCDDSNDVINPGATELCGNTVDEDCTCDHGSTIGHPYLKNDGTFNCSEVDSYLDCNSLPRSDSNPVGFCADSPEPFYFGFYGDSETDKDCYYCGREYGKACDELTKACQTKAASCSDCDFIGTLAEIRPDCTVPGAGCLNSTAPVWIALVGEDSNNECDAVSCAGYFWGIENNRCYEREDQLANEVDCNGQATCEVAADLCPIESDKKQSSITAPAICVKIASGCDGQVQPTWTNQDNNEDLFEDCTEAFTCDDSNGQQGHYYGLVDPNPSDENDDKACHFQANIESNSCNSLGACQDRSQACGTSGVGAAVSGTHARPQCQRPTEDPNNSTCVGTIAPTYENITPGEDPYQECTGSGCCLNSQGNGACCAPISAPCMVNSECETGICRTGWDGSGLFCAESSTTCVYDDGQTVHQRAHSHVECAGADEFKICQNGNWTASVPCSSTTCAGGCGYITNQDNACISGADTSVAGCEAILQLDVTCLDCGDFTAKNGGCNSALSACSTTCGAPCNQEQTWPSGQLYCSAVEGESMNRVFTCQVSTGNCGFADDSDVNNDQIETSCTANHIDCSVGTGICLTSCVSDSDCNSGYHCEGGSCLQDLGPGNVCDEDSDCVSQNCREDWGGTLQRCAQDSSSCIYVSGGTVHQRSDGYVECAGGDSYQICNSGSWISITECNATMCNSGCGYITDGDNACTNGSNINTGGCEAVLGQGINCVDCGHLTAVAGACNAGLGNCSTACGANCEQGDSTIGAYYCQGGDDGNSYARIDTCSESASTCSYTDDGGGNDTLNTDCGASNCNAGTGLCLGSCGDDSECNTGYHCDGGNCLLDLDDGEVCDEDSDCVSSACHTDWDGSGDYCASGATTCVYNNSGSNVLQRAHGYIECAGSDGHKACSNGVWGSTNNCDATTCNSGCGYITDGDNACVSGSSLASAGCEADLSQGVSCVDCGDFTASNGSCNSNLLNCSSSCGSPCNSGDSTDSGNNYCSSEEGNSMNQIFTCQVSSGNCGFANDFITSNDTISTVCTTFNLDCNTGSGECRTSCSSNAHCHNGYHCDGGACFADVVNGGACNENSDCVSGECRDDWDGSGQFCASSPTTCVYDDTSSVNQRADGYVECAGGDAYQICDNGVWISSSSCDATTCDGGCGYITDNDNACLNGANTQVGGCEATLDQGVSCVDCGDFTAVNGSCNADLGSCDSSCGSSCEQGQTNQAGLYCQPDASGNSYQQIDTCALSGGGCAFVDDGQGNDTLSADCGASNCNIGNGACVGGCASDSDCNNGYHCDGGSCIDDVSDGGVCDEDSDCESGACREDWDTNGEFCASSSTACVYDDGASVHQRAHGYEECTGGDGYKTCASGVWSSATNCNATTCNGGCGYITDNDNACVSGANGGCEADLDQDVNCVDCGDFTAIAGDCNTEATDCSTACGANCDAGSTFDSGTNYCAAEEGESMNLIYTCQVSGGECEFEDDADTGNDTTAEACTGSNIDCNTGTGACYPNCSTDGECNSGYHCEVGACAADVANGGSCDEATDCVSGHCQNDFCCGSGDCCSVAGDCPGSYSAAATCNDASGCQGNRDDASCGSSQCSTSTIQDDSACTSAIEVDTCGFYDSVFCNGNSTQSAPSCANSCITDGECDANAHCDNACLEDLTTGAICDEATDCDSGACRADYSGGTSYCASSSTVCVHHNGSAVVETANSAKVCDGADTERTCSNGTWGSSSSCGTYICSGNACLATCSANDDADCSTGNYCDGSDNCVGQVGPGIGCTKNSACSNNTCRDGYCCAAECGGGVGTDCQSCDGAETGGINGECSTITIAYECNPAGANATCDPADSCDGVGTTCPSNIAADGTSCGGGLTCSSGNCQ